MEYAKLTTPQRWEWHAGVYAFRRVVLGVPHDERTSPPDPDGKWFDEVLVAAAEKRLRQKYEKTARDCANDTAARNAVRFADAARWRNSPEGRRFLQGLHQSTEPRARFNPHAAAAALGVTAREYSPTPEQMAKGRRELGLEPDDSEGRTMMPATVDSRLGVETKTDEISNG